MYAFQSGLSAGLIYVYFIELFSFRGWQRPVLPATSCLVCLERKEVFCLFSLVFMWINHTFFGEIRFISNKIKWILSSRPCLTRIVEGSSSSSRKRKWRYLSFWLILIFLRHHFLIIWMSSRELILSWMREEGNLCIIGYISRFLRRA